MISALARAATITGRDDYKKLSIKSMDFILANLKQNDRKLFKRYRKGSSSIDGMIEDFAFLVWGLIEMYQLTFDLRYLDEAKILSDYQFENFWDKLLHHLPSVHHFPLQTLLLNYYYSVFLLFFPDKNFGNQKMCSFLVDDTYLELEI